MPTRYLKESICTSENLAQLSAEAERFWYRLLVQVDDYGRLDARLPILRSKCFPLQLDCIGEPDIHAWLSELERAGLIRLYTVDKRPHLEILTFCKHNQPRAKVSKWPEPPPVAGTCTQMPTSANECSQIPSESESESESNIEDRISESESESNIEDRISESESESKISAATPQSSAAQTLPAAVQVFLDNGGQFPTGKLADGTPKKRRAIAYIAERVRDSPESLALWGQVVAAYCAQWSGKSYTVMIDEYYAQNRVPGQAPPVLRPAYDLDNATPVRLYGKPGRNCNLSPPENMTSEERKLYYGGKGDGIVEM